MDVARSLRLALSLSLLLALLSPRLFLATLVCWALLWLWHTKVGWRRALRSWLAGSLLSRVCDGVLVLGLLDVVSPMRWLRRLSEALGWERAQPRAPRAPLARLVLQLKDSLVASLTRVSGTVTAVASPLWPHCHPTLKLLCFSTGIFISACFLFKVCFLVTQNFSLTLVLRHSLTRVALAVTELLATVFWTTSILLRLPLQLACRLLCFASSVCTSLFFVAYSLASMFLVGTQNLFMLLISLWHLLSRPVIGVTELLVMVLLSVFRAVFILLGLPFQLIFKLLSFSIWVFITAICATVYVLGLLLRVVCGVALLGVLLYNRELLWELLGHGLAHLQRDLRRRCQDIIRAWQGRGHGQHLPLLVMGMDIISQALLAARRTWQGRGTNQGRAQQGADPRPAPAPGQLHRGAQGHGTQWGDGGAPEQHPLERQEQQAGGNKCVICQDQTKTVLLLPCRHLCLCQECTETLLEQDTDQRNCPLCRQMILQTLNVYL